MKTLLIEIVEAISEMNTLKELNAVIVVDDPLFMDTITLFAELIKRNATLRRLRLPSSLNVCLKSSWDPDKQFPDPQAATCMKSLCEALQESNSSLSQLSIDLRPFEEAECHAFFGAVADNKEIKSVVVKSLPCIDGIDRVSTTIRERGLDDRVVVKSFCIHHNTIKLQQCPQIYNATIASSKTISNVLPSVMTALPSLSLIEFTGIPASIFNAMHHEARGEVRSHSVHKAEAFREAANHKESALLDILQQVRLAS
nr:uncharacterized protein LOC129388036 [Dermacentor andersoni]